MNRLLWLAQRTISLQRIKPLLRNNEFELNHLFNVLRNSSKTNLRTFKTLNNLQQQQKSSSSEKSTTSTNAQKKPKISPKITLVAQDQSISVTTLEEANKLAKRRDLHLLLLQELDTKTQRPVYKLITQAELLAEELSDLKVDEKNTTGKDAAKKSEKTLTIGSRISDHDLASRQKNICKWLAKQHEVRILIQGGADDMPKMEKICKALEQSITVPELLGKIQQKRSKGSHIKFIIAPIATTASKSNDGRDNVAGTAKKTSTAA